MLDHWVKQEHKATCERTATLVDLVTLGPYLTKQCDNRKDGFDECHNCQSKEKLTHKPSRVCFVSPNFAIYLDDPLHDDFGHFTAGQSILETIPKNDDEWK